MVKQAPCQVSVYDVVGGYFGEQTIQETNSTLVEKDPNTPDAASPATDTRPVIKRN